MHTKEENTMTKQFNPNSYPKSISRIPLTQINVADYQRVVRESTVRKIINNFDPRGLGSLLVSKRDGKYWVFDGQHRLRALQALGAKTAECIVYEGMTYLDEAKAWDYFNLKSSRATRLDQANAEIKRGDTFAIALNETVEETGLSIDYQQTGRDGYISAYIALEKIYKEYGRDRLQKTLRFIKQVFGLSRKAFQRSMMIGMTEFFVRYEKNPKFDQRFLEKRLVNNGLQVLLNLATRNKKQYNQTLEEATVSALLELYNSNKKFENRLR